MAFRLKEAAVALCLTAASVFASEVRVEVRHDHLRGAGLGVLVADDNGIRFEEQGGKHDWKLAWDDVQQLWVSPKKLRVLTYADTWWKLGADRKFELNAASSASFEPLYAAYKDRLGQKLVAAMADEPGAVEWRVPVKLREKFGGPEGVLLVGAQQIVFESPERGKSRTWRFADIDNISSAGPFELTVTAYERAGADRRSFHFQLKRPLEQARYDALWRLLNQSKQIDYLSSIQEK